MSKKPYIHKRLIAYVIDILIISFVSSILAMPFTKNDEYEKLAKELYEITDKYKQEVKTSNEYNDNVITSNEITNEDVISNEYLNAINDISYKMTKANLSQTIVVIIVSVLYYVLFNYYNKGQTIGKKIMKLRIIEKDGNDLNLNNYIIRMLVANPALANIVTIILILTLSKEEYLIYESKFSTVFGIIYILCFLFALYRSDGKGLHDLLAGTVVINDKIENNNIIKEGVIVKEENDKEVK